MVNGRFHELFFLSLVLLSDRQRERERERERERAPIKREDSLVEITIVSN
jgi:hypothetical protein